jgi:sigma-B regulation protein RsbU (phosphoserine phosphatase)
VTSHASEMLVTLFLGLIDCERSRLWYVNCGHPPALRLLVGDSKPGELGVGGMVLGVTEEAKYETGECDFAPGETLVLVSDGVTEAMNPARELYGEERLVRVLSGSQSLGAIDNMQRILDNVDEFMEGSEQEDDISIVVLKRAF